MLVSSRRPNQLPDVRGSTSGELFDVDQFQVHPCAHHGDRRSSSIGLGSSNHSRSRAITRALSDQPQAVRSESQSRHGRRGEKPCSNPAPDRGAIVMSAGAVVVYFSRLGGFMYTHERVVLSAVAEAIAEIKH